MKNIDWVKGAVIYQIYPDSFARSARHKADGVFERWDAPETPEGFKGGNLAGAEEKLDYLLDLGVTAVYFNPIFASTANHRYHTYDYYRVDPILGGDAALRSFIKAAHKRGIKVILDGVFNHASRGFFQFNHVLENGKASPYRRWFHAHGYPLKAYNLGVSERPNYACWWNLPALPKFNTDNPEVRRFILGVARYWLEFGIDGWRLDAPHEINDDAFWREFRRVCKKANPGCYITGEIWGPAQRWLKGDQFDAVMNYQLSAGCISYFGGEKLRLTHSYDGRRLKPIGRAEFMAGIEKLLGYYKFGTTLAQMNMLSSHDTDRMWDTYGGDAARVKLAAVFSYLFPGAVNLYYGEELGLAGVLNGGTSRGMPWNNRKIWNRDLLALYKALGALRRNNPVIKEGRFEFLKSHCAGNVMAFRRFLPGGGQLVCFMNKSDRPAQVSASAALLRRAPGAVINGGVAIKTVPGGAELAMPPMSYIVFEKP
jgi:neopullulanase